MRIKFNPDHIFLAIFFLLLIIPAQKMSMEEISEQENRRLAQMPKLTTPTGINTQFSKQFEKWFNDRFLGRTSLLRLNSYLIEHLNTNISSPHGMVGKEDWLFSKEFNAVDMARNANLLSKEQLAHIGKNIKEFTQNAKSIGIKQVYFLINNDKESLYKEYYPQHIKVQESTSRLEQIVQYMRQNHPDLNVLNYKNEFLKLKKDHLLFCKPGTHKTAIGSYYEYATLMNRIRQDFPSLKVLDLDDFNRQPSHDCNKDIYSSMNLQTYNKDNFKNEIFEVKYPSQILRTKSNNNRYLFFQHINQSNPHGLKIWIISDSFFHRYQHYLAESFATTHTMFYGFGNNFDLNEKDIESIKSNKPDILVVETTERFLYRFSALHFYRN